MFRSTLLAGAFAVTLFTPAHSQNDPDMEITSALQSQPWLFGRALDMAYTEEGELIVAYSELHPTDEDQLVVASWYRSRGAWTQLFHFRLGFLLPYDHIVDLSIAVPYRSSGGDPELDRVYVLLQLAKGHKGAGGESLVLVSGPSFRPWVGVRAAIVGGLPATTRPFAAVKPTLACVPRQPKDYSSYVVEMAFMHAQGSRTWVEDSIYRAWSLDYGHSIETPVEIAGSCSNGVADGHQHGLIGPLFGHPSLAAGDELGAFVIAFMDSTRDSVHVVDGLPGVPIMNHSWETPTADGRAETYPIVTIDEQNQVFFTCLSDRFDPQGGTELLWYSGLPFQGLGFVELGLLHHRAVTPADLQVLEGTLYAVARAHVDQGTSDSAVLAFEGPLAGPKSATQVNDAPCWSHQPRVATTPDHAPFVNTAYGFTRDDWRANWLLYADWVYLDL